MRYKYALYVWQVAVFHRGRKLTAVYGMQMRQEPELHQSQGLNVPAGLGRMPGRKVDMASDTQRPQSAPGPLRPMSKTVACA